jgi:hypothetical protein
MKKNVIQSYWKPAAGVLGAAVVAVAVILLLPPYAPNPDPNHTHADFAVWVGGKQLDFSDAKYMSGLSTDETTHDEASEVHDQYYHLHDNNGHVIHRHKPGLPLTDFFGSIGFSVASEKQGEYCWYQMKDDRPFDGCLSGPMHLYVNGVRYVNPTGLEDFNPLLYVFKDDDQLLLTDATDEREINREIGQLTSDACKYSKTCPYKGAPPTENCIADPTVPCVVQ